MSPRYFEILHIGGCYLISLTVVSSAEITPWPRPSSCVSCMCKRSPAERGHDQHPSRQYKDKKYCFHYEWIPLLANGNWLVIGGFHRFSEGLGETGG